ncbi:MAG: flippase-like domain-containing protein [Candidatus Heimdallarchaeota archaeon]|nr:flippase-like domain-containing protein [Candidatus Heimdallarchaeota archaeon]
MAFLIWKSEPLKLWNTFLVSNPWLLLASFGITIVLFLIKNIRWQSILVAQDHKVTFKELWLLLFVGTYGSVITPAKVGDILRAFYLTKRNEEVPMGHSVFSVVFDRLLDFVAIFLLTGIMAPFILININVSWWIPVGIVGAFVLFLIMLLFFFNDKIGKPIIYFLVKIISRVFSKKSAQDKITLTTEEIVGDFYSCQKNYRLYHYLWLSFLSLLYWVILGLQGSVLLLAFQATNIKIYVVISVLCIAALTAFSIPISLSGIGVRDATTMSLLYLILGIELDHALMLSIIQTFFNMIIPGFVGGLLSIPLTRKFEEKQLAQPSKEEKEEK